MVPLRDRLVAGLLTGLSWQPYALWPLLLIGLPAFTLVVRGVRRRRAFGLGYVFGLAMLGVSISWIHVLGVWIAILLIAFEALFFALLGLVINLVSVLRWWPLAAACCWVLIEFAYARIPLGGFGWGKLAYTGVDTPLAGFYPLIGVAGVSFLVALLGQLVAYGGAPAVAGPSTEAPGADGAGGDRAGGGHRAAWDFGSPNCRSPIRRRNRRSASASSRATSRAAASRRSGRARTVTNNHLAETVNLTVKARLGQVQQPDFILWPENSTDIDPLLDGATRATVQAAAEVAGRPILVGAVLAGPGPGRAPDRRPVVGPRARGRRPVRQAQSGPVR